MSAGSDFLSQDIASAVLQGIHVFFYKQLKLSEKVLSTCFLTLVLLLCSTLISWFFELLLSTLSEESIQRIIL